MARIGQFGLPTSQYGQKVATVPPADNNTTMTAAQAAQAQANAQAQYLLQLIAQYKAQTPPKTPAPTPKK